MLTYTFFYLGNTWQKRCILIRNAKVPDNQLVAKKICDRDGEAVHHDDDKLF
jgi:hypothetical protein